MVRRISRLMLVLSLVICVGLGILSMFSSRPANLGHVNGRLAECPASPNCVASQTESDAHRMSALSFSGTAANAVLRLKQVVGKKFPRAELVQEDERYLHFQFTSFLFRFVDDVEFLVDDERGQIQFRSASRVGHSDLGVNRRRMTTIIEEFHR